MDYSPWGHKESDTTKLLTHTHIKSTVQIRPIFCKIHFYAQEKKRERGQIITFKNNYIYRSAVLTLR